MIDKSRYATDNVFIHVLLRILAFWATFIALGLLVGASILDFIGLLLYFDTVRKHSVGGPSKEREQQQNNAKVMFLLG